jgi:hypothetical protein
MRLNFANISVRYHVDTRTKPQKEKKKIGRKSVPSTGGVRPQHEEAKRT